jgi:hypothetical protein
MRAISACSGWLPMFDRILFLIGSNAVPISYGLLFCGLAVIFLL